MNIQELNKLHSDNCVKLAQFLETLPDNAHSQHAWMMHSDYAECGTVGCALGWAVHGGLIDVETEEYRGISGKANVIRVAKDHDWRSVGVAHYGGRAFQRIFLNVAANKIETINALYAEARRLCNLAGGTEQKE